jgi:hypothetical protein
LFRPYRARTWAAAEFLAGRCPGLICGYPFGAEDGGATNPGLTFQRCKPNFSPRQCRTLPAHFRPGFSHDVVTTLRADNCGTRAAGAIPAASTFSEHASTGDSGRHSTSKHGDCRGVASHEVNPVLRQEATARGGQRPARATESATGQLSGNPELAVVVAAWPELPETVRAGIVAMVRAARG